MIIEGVLLACLTFSVEEKVQLEEEQESFLWETKGRKGTMLRMKTSIGSVHDNYGCLLDYANGGHSTHWNEVRRAKI